MSRTIKERLNKDLAEWLESMAAKTGVSQYQLIRDQLERAKADAANKSFMRLAGEVRGPKDLSRRKGFNRMKGIADTGFLAAFANRNDRHHGWAVSVAEIPAVDLRAGRGRRGAPLEGSPRREPWGRS